MNTDTKFDMLARRGRRIALAHAALNLDGAAHGVDRASEFNQGTVAGPLDDATAMLGDLGLQQFAAVGIHPR
jgi:hypothetical protein